jgi:hypothetical protein
MEGISNYKNPTGLTSDEVESNEWVTFAALAKRLNESPDKYRENPITKSRVTQMAILGHLPESYGGNILETGYWQGVKFIKILEKKYSFKKRGRPNKKNG